jgi:DNA-binding GntR family transcriptional regulator
MEGRDASSRPLTSQEVVHEIRQAIMTRKLTPGEWVRQFDLAERLNVSSVPVREALRTLEAEGQVTYQPNRGYTVVQLSVRELEELYLIRRLLETEAARQAVPKFDAELIQRLEALIARMDESIESGDVVRYTETNRDFHLLLSKRAGLPRLYHLIEVLWQNSEACRSAIFSRSWCQRAQRDHQAILKACKSKDVAEVIVAQDKHRSKGLAAIIAFLQEENGT